MPEVGTTVLADLFIRILAICFATYAVLTETTVYMVTIQYRVCAESNKTLRKCGEVSELMMYSRGGNPICYHGPQKVLLYGENTKKYTIFFYFRKKNRRENYMEQERLRLV